MVADELPQGSYTALEAVFGETRLAAHSERGSKNFRAVLASAGVTEGDLAACLALAQADSKFAFLHSLPHAVAVGSAAADTLETGLGFVLCRQQRLCKC